MLDIAKVSEEVRKWTYGEVLGCDPQNMLNSALEWAEKAGRASHSLAELGWRRPNQAISSETLERATSLALIATMNARVCWQFFNTAAEEKKEDVRVSHLRHLIKAYLTAKEASQEVADLLEVAEVAERESHYLDGGDSRPEG